MSGPSIEIQEKGSDGDNKMKWARKIQESTCMYSIHLSSCWELTFDRQPSSSPGVGGGIWGLGWNDRSSAHMDRNCVHWRIEWYRACCWSDSTTLDIDIRNVSQEKENTKVRLNLFHNFVQFFHDWYGCEWIVNIAQIKRENMSRETYTVNAVPASLWEIRRHGRSSLEEKERMNVFLSSVECYKFF